MKKPLQPSERDAHAAADRLAALVGADDARLAEFIAGMEAQERETLAALSRAESLSDAALDALLREPDLNLILTAAEEITFPPELETLPDFAAAEDIDLDALFTDEDDINRWLE